MLIAFACATAFAQQPQIVSVSPSSGPISGGTIVTITGINFTGATVTLDRSPLVPLSHSDSEIRARMPKHDNGYAVIAIGTSYGEFLFLPPRLDELPPGYITTIAGVGFFTGDYRPATRAFVAPWGISFDASDNVNFSAPSAAATCALSSAFAITNADGIATVSCIPNCVAGAYDVIAHPITGSSTARVFFVNAATPCRRRAVRR